MVTIVEYKMDCKLNKAHDMEVIFFVRISGNIF